MSSGPVITNGRTMSGDPKPKHRGLTLKQRRILIAYLFIAIPLVFFVAIRIAPAFSAMSMSFFKWNIISENKPFIGLENYRAMLEDDVFKQSLVNTSLYVLIGVPGQLTIGLALALLIQRVNKFRGLFRTIYFIPYVTSSVAVSWVWRFMFMKHSGIINGILLKLGLPQQDFLGNPAQAIYIIVASMVWQALGFQVVIFLAGLETIPKVFYEAAQIDGASEWQAFRRVTLPLLNPTIVFSAVMGTIGFLQTFTQVMNMSSQGRGGPLNSTISLVLYIYQVAFEKFKMGYASAMTAVLFGIIMIITLIQLKVLTKRFEY